MNKEEGWGRISGSPGNKYNKKWGWVKSSGLLQSWGTTRWLYLQELREKEGICSQPMASGARATCGIPGRAH